MSVGRSAGIGQSTIVQALPDVLSRRQPFSKRFAEEDPTTTVAVHLLQSGKKVRHLAPAGDHKQTQFALADSVTEELEHRQWVGAFEPFRLSHGPPLIALAQEL